MNYIKNKGGAGSVIIILILLAIVIIGFFLLRSDKGEEAVEEGLTGNEQVDQELQEVDQIIDETLNENDTDQLIEDLENQDLGNETQEI